MSQPDPIVDLDDVRALARLAGLSLTDAELTDVAATLRASHRVLAAWPEAALRAVEPPLRAVPAPGDGRW